MTLLSGKVVAKTVTILLTPVITRLFDPEDFGIAALFVAIMMVVSQGASLRYDQAIVLPKDELDAYKLVSLSLGILFMLTTVLAVVVSVAGILDPKIEWVNNLGIWLFFLPVGIFLAGFSNIALGYSLREKQFKTMAAAAIVESSGSGGVRIINGLMHGSSVGGLVTGTLAGLVFRSVLLALRIKGLLLTLVRQWPSMQDFRRIITKYKDFPRYSLPTVLLRSLFQHFPIFMLSYLFSPAVVGFYAISNRLVKMPIALFSDSFRRVFLQKIAEMQNAKRSIEKALLKTTLLLALGGACCFLPIFLYAEELFALLLGSAWAPAGVYTAILTPWFLSMFVQAPSAAVMVVFRKQEFLLRIQIVALIFAAIVFLVAKVLLASPEEALAYFTVVSALANIGVIFYAFRFIRTIKTQDAGQV